MEKELAQLAALMARNNQVVKRPINNVPPPNELTDLFKRLTKGQDNG